MQLKSLVFLFSALSLTMAHGRESNDQSGRIGGHFNCVNLNQGNSVDETMSPGRIFDDSNPPSPQSSPFVRSRAVSPESGDFLKRGAHFINQQPSYPTLPPFAWEIYKAVINNILPSLESQNWLRVTLKNYPQEENLLILRDLINSLSRESIEYFELLVFSVQNYESSYQNAVVST